MSPDSLIKWLSAAGDFSILIIAYFLWTIKHNHLPHIYNKLSELERGMFYNRGKIESQAKWERGNYDTDEQIGPNT